MFAIAIDCGDQRRKGRATLAGDLLQTVPELVFKADARLVACNDNRALRNRRLHGFCPRISHRYYMTAWLCGQENPLALLAVGPGQVAPRGLVRDTRCWKRPIEIGLCSSPPQNPARDYKGVFAGNE